MISGSAAAALALSLSHPVAAQRTDDNAVTQSDDAFGKSVGDERIGIYNPDNVRGFSPVDAGNLRIEGLYFDQQAGPTSRLVDGNTIRVGISAQGYPFPAPTGIADYSLRKPGAETVASVGLRFGPLGSKVGELDLQLPIDGKRLGVFAGIGYYAEENLSGSRPTFVSAALGARYVPSDRFEIMPFWSRIYIRGEEAQPLIFTNGAFLPTRIPRGRFFGQKWADFSGENDNYGVVAKARSFGLDAELGVFRSVSDGSEDHFDLMFDTDRAGNVGRRVVIAAGANRFASTSGEFRLSKSFTEGNRVHTLIGSIKARRQNRRFGGEDVIDLGPSFADRQDFRPEPTRNFGAKTLDKVSQHTLGIGYRGRWKDVGELSIGLQKTDYKKSITEPDPTIMVPDSVSKPWLFNANAALLLSSSLALYGGYTRGLEESPVAPSNAVNLNDAPPAIRTTQKEAGLRWTVSPGVSLVLGVFDIEKPYFNLDGSDRFRQLGAIRRRGLEFSLAGEVAPGLNLVAGNVLQDAEVSGEEVDLGLIGDKPIGAFTRHTIISMDYQLPWHKPLSFNAYFEGTSDRTANAANTLVVPTRAVVSLGARYRVQISRIPTLFRFNVENVTNTFGWGVGGSGFFVPNGQRRYTLSLAADL